MTEQSLLSIPHFKTGLDQRVELLERSKTATGPEQAKSCLTTFSANSDTSVGRVEVSVLLKIALNICSLVNIFSQDRSMVLQLNVTLLKMLLYLKTIHQLRSLMSHFKQLSRFCMRCYQIQPVRAASRGPVHAGHDVTARVISSDQMNKRSQVYPSRMRCLCRRSLTT